MNGSDSSQQKDFDAAVAAYRSGDFGLAHRLAENLLDGDPDSADALQLLSAIKVAAGDPQAAVAHARRALASAPGHYGAQVTLAGALHAAGQSEEALRLLDALAKASPDKAEPLINAAMVRLDTGAWDEALAAAESALALDPANVAALSNKAAALQRIGAIEDAVANFKSARTLEPGNADVLRNLLTVVHYDPHATHRDIFELTRAYWSAVPKPEPAESGVETEAVVEPKASGAPLHLGFISPDFREHPVGHFLQPVLAGLDPARFRVTLYANQTDADSVTHALRRNAAWVPVKHLSDAEVAARIAADGVDLLIELAGFTDNHRLGVMRLKPAPVQASWLGYVATTGLDEIDYVIADRHVWPPDQDEYFTERPMRLPNTYFCFEPPAQRVPVGPPPLARNGYVTFGSLNNPVKLNRVCLAVWRDILDAVSGSKLLLKAPQLSDPRMFQHVARMCADSGLAENRLIVMGRTPRAEHLAAYNQVDLILDPFPYGGGLTTAEAVWMGAPVVTLAGARWVARAGVSILNTVGMPHLIAEDVDAYRDLAIRLAGDAAELTSLRTILRPAVDSSPLCNQRRFVRDVERAFFEMAGRT